MYQRLNANDNTPSIEGKITTKQFINQLRRRANERRPTGEKWSDCQKMTPEQFNSLFKD